MGWGKGGEVSLAGETWAQNNMVARIRGYGSHFGAATCTDKARLLRGHSTVNAAVILAEACREGWAEQLRGSQGEPGEQQEKGDSEAELFTSSYQAVRKLSDAAKAPEIKKTASFLRRSRFDI